MKIRNGFISNSSSSSFIIRDGRTTVEVAMTMLEIVFDEFDNIFPDHEKDDSKEKAINWLKKNKDYEGSILIPFTTNYETWIYSDWTKMGVIFIDTCNNHDWSDLEPTEWCSDTDYSYDMVEEMSKNNTKFFDLSSFKFITRDDFLEERKRMFEEAMKRRRAEN